MQTKILFLYTELAEYFIACVETLINEYGVEVHIVRFPVNKEAPFQFSIPGNVNVYDKQDFSRERLIELSKDINPDLIFCSGWVDKDYLAVVKSFKKKIPVLVGMDNHWRGSLKQQVARLLAPFTLQQFFTHAFVAGEPQQLYALKLGFNKSCVIQGFYSANVVRFQQAFMEAKSTKQNFFPKRFIYVGRYVPHKGIQELWTAFVQLQQELPNEWELWCLGTGPLQPKAVQHAKIKHFDFVQPQQMQPFIRETGVFVLPSHFEPWGVVVHEFATAGFPILCSQKVGAATAFLKEGLNGFSFKAGDVAGLKEVMKQVVQSADSVLLEMGEQSARLALENTPSKWAKKIMTLVPH